MANLERLDRMPSSLHALARAFASRRAPPEGDVPLQPLETLLAGFVERCARAWPEVRLVPEDFARHLGRHCPAGAAEAGLRGMCCEDLFLALGCLGGDRAALEGLERTVLAPAGRAVRRLDDTPAFVDEVMQLTRIRLLVGSVRQGPRLEEYAGKGALPRWTEAVALGVAVSLKRQPREVPLPEEVLLASALDSADPELAVLRARYRPAFLAAFVEALARLSARDRNLLRLSVIQGLGVESLGVLHQVHASTASRWLARARGDLRAGLRRGLAERLRLDTPQLDSLLRALEGHLEVSLSVLLREG